ncbi:patatin-like phospholipase family protein [uncultured Porphyromonas sp.]|nr:patatin-like phospholipase family protein [uncultured Porphyromonas sp.]
MIALCTPATMQGQQSDDICDSTQMRCGLVLSGGGAKGLAHIALLELIDSLQIQVDYISGTSMGAVVAGLYATGYSAAEIKELVSQEDWGRILSNRLPYDKIDMYEKEDYGTYTLEFPLHRGVPKAPSSIIEGQYLMEMLMRYTFPVRHIKDYAQMPLPLQLVASDVGSGGAYVMTSGSIPLSIRASLAIPAFFAPAIVDGRLLVDGGLDRNFPVEEVRAMGATFVIGSYTGARLRSVEELEHSSIGVIHQSYALLTKKEVERQVSLVDVMLDFSQALKDYTSSDFSQRDQIIALAEVEAHKLLPQLIALKAQQVAQGINYQERQLATVSIPIQQVKITDQWGAPLDHAETEFIRSVIGEDLSLLDSVDLLQQRMDMLMGYNRYAQVYYTYEADSTVTADHEVNTLHFFIKKKPQALLRVGAYYDPYESANIILNTSFRDILLSNSRLSAKLAISQHPKLRASYYKWFDDSYSYWVSPYISLRLDRSDNLHLRYLSQIEDHTEATFYQGSIATGLKMGYALSPQSEITLGVQYGLMYVWQPQTPFDYEMIGSAQDTDLELTPFNYFNQLLHANKRPKLSYRHGSWTMNLAYQQNSLNRKAFATRGNHFALTAELTLKNSYSLSSLPEDATESQKQIYNLLNPKESLSPQQGPLLHLSVYEHIVAPLSQRVALHGRLFGGVNLDLGKPWRDSFHYDSYLFLSQKFNLGGFANLGMDNQTIFSGLRYREYPVNNLAALYLGVQYTPVKDLYVTPHVSVGMDIQAPNVRDSDLLYGAGIDLDYDSLIGPIKLSFTRSNVLRTSRFFFSLGYAF